MFQCIVGILFFNKQSNNRCARSTFNKHARCCALSQAYMFAVSLQSILFHSIQLLLPGQDLFTDCASAKTASVSLTNIIGRDSQADSYSFLVRLLFRHVFSRTSQNRSGTTEHARRLKKTARGGLLFFSIPPPITFCRTLPQLARTPHTSKDEAHCRNCRPLHGQ